MTTFEMGLRLVRGLRSFFRINWHLLLIKAAVILMAAPAQAYIDPGVGGMLVQLLLGGVAGVVVIMPLYWERITSAVRKILGRPNNKQELPSDSNDDDGSGA